MFNKMKNRIFGAFVIAVMGLTSMPATAQLDGLLDIGGLSGLLTTSAIGVDALPDLGGGEALEALPLGGLLGTGGVEELIAVGIDIIESIVSGGGIGAFPLIGSDLDILFTMDGAQSGLTGLLISQELPVGLPVIGRAPIKLYTPVVMTLLGTQGIPLPGL